MMSNCQNCGAPVHGYQCEYCGTVFYDYDEIVREYKIELEQVRLSALQIAQMNRMLSNASLSVTRPSLF